MNFDNFTDKLTQDGKSSLTIRQYRSSWNRFTDWMNNQDGESGRGTYGGRGVLETLHLPSQMDIALFKTWANRQFKPSTVRQTLTHIRAYFSFLVAHGESPDNPVEYVDGIIQAREVPRWLSRNEQNTLVRVVRKYGDLRELAIVTAMLHTGLRVQELCDIRITSDIVIGERSGKFIVRDGKAHRFREVPLNVDARRVLSKYIAEVNPMDFLFGTQRSSKATTRAIQHLFEKYRKLSGIEHLSAHALRHTFCHELVARKIPLDVVARLAGHMKNDGSPNIQQTLVYTMPGEADLRAAVEELSWV